MTIEQVQSAKGLPPVATKIVGDEIRIIQQETWTSLDHADIVVNIPGKPGEISGTINLTERDGITVEKIDLKITVRVPLIGGKLEGLVADILGKAIDRERKTGVAWLA